MKHMVVGFLYNEDDEVLLVKKIKPTWQFDQWNGVGGKIEKGETPAEAMRREFIEETRIGNYYDFEHKATVVGFFGTLFVFAAHGFKKAFKDMPPRNDVDEELRWWPKSTLPGNMIYNLPWLIRFCKEQPLTGPIVIQEPMKCES